MRETNITFTYASETRTASESPILAMYKVWSRRRPMTAVLPFIHPFLLDASTIISSVASNPQLIAFSTSPFFNYDVKQSIKSINAIYSVTQYLFAAKDVFMQMLLDHLGCINLFVWKNVSETYQHSN